LDLRELPVRMNCVPGTTLRIGPWYVMPSSGVISREGESVQIETRSMMLLVYLAQRAGEVVSIDDILSQVWTGLVVTPDSVYQAVASLRRHLGDDPKKPGYIATVPRFGYRMVAAVSHGSDPAVAPTAASPDVAEVSAVQATRKAPHRAALRILSPRAAVAGACLGLVLMLVLWSHSRLENERHLAAATRAPQHSVAVLPFLDLTTQDMSEEYFADGMTEELIDKLSKIPSLRVPSPTSSFYFKGKQMSVADMAKSLGVIYVLDGSVRKSDTTLRVAARLVRAADGYVIWSETYDRPSADRLMVQDDIANEVTKVLRVAVH
jgi:transcriptional activator of cad operon